MTGPVTPEARTMGPPDAKCGQCRQFESFPGDETAGRCLNQPWDHAQHGTIYGLAFAREGADGCEGYAPRAGAPAAIPDTRPDPDEEEDVASGREARDPFPSQRAGNTADATAPTPAVAPGETVVACGACSAMRERAEAAEALVSLARAYVAADKAMDGDRPGSLREAQDAFDALDLALGGSR